MEVINILFSIIRLVLILASVYFLVKSYRQFPDLIYGDTDIRIMKSIYYVLISIVFLLFAIRVMQL